jgi:small subunit ribosomal protein S2
LDPGAYRLRLELPGGRALEQTLIASPGWQTQYFALLHPYTAPGQASDQHLTSTGVPDLARASILLSELNRGFAPNDNNLRRAELARLGLAHDRMLLAESDMIDILHGKFGDPMLGLYGAHLLLMQQKSVREEFDEVISNLRRLLGDAHPDVEALAIRSSERGTPNGVHGTPPMLRRSWRMLVEATVADPDLIPKDSLADRVARRIEGDGPWMVWLASEVGAEDEVEELIREYVLKHRNARAPMTAFHAALTSVDRKIEPPSSPGTGPLLSEGDVARLVAKLGVPRRHVEAIAETVQVEAKPDHTPVIAPPRNRRSIPGRDTAQRAGWLATAVAGRVSRCRTPTIQELLEAGVHFGHQTSRWNPKMRRFIFAERNGIYIIDLKKTLRQIELAQELVHNVISRGDRVLFVCTKKQLRQVIQSEATRSSSAFVTERWLGGMLTNFATQKKQIRRLRELERGQEEGAFDFYTKKERLTIERERERLEKYLGGVKDMARLPGALFVVDAKRESIAISEANKLGIPVIAIADTNADPDVLTVPIAGNDDAIRSVTVISSAISDAIIEARAAMPPEARRAADEAEVTVYSTETGTTVPVERGQRREQRPAAVPVERGHGDEPRRRPRRKRARADQTLSSTFIPRSEPPRRAIGLGEEDD